MVSGFRKRCPGGRGPQRPQHVGGWTGRQAGGVLSSPGQALALRQCLAHRDARNIRYCWQEGRMPQALRASPPRVSSWEDSSSLTSHQVPPPGWPGLAWASATAHPGGHSSSPTLACPAGWAPSGPVPSPPWPLAPRPPCTASSCKVTAGFIRLKQSELLILMLSLSFSFNKRKRCPYLQ